MDIDDLVWIYPLKTSYIHGYIWNMDITMDISTTDISKWLKSMDISKRNIFFGYIRYPYIHGYKRYIQMYLRRIYLFVDISKKIYLFMDIMKWDITGYIDNGCIQKHTSNTDISKKHISKMDISKKDISNTDISEKDISNTDISNMNFSQVKQNICNMNRFGATFWEK